MKVEGDRLWVAGGLSGRVFAYDTGPAARSPTSPSRLRARPCSTTWWSPPTPSTSPTPSHRSCSSSRCPRVGPSVHRTRWPSPGPPVRTWVSPASTASTPPSPATCWWWGTRSSAACTRWTRSPVSAPRSTFPPAQCHPACPTGSCCAAGPCGSSRTSPNRVVELDLTADLSAGTVARVVESEPVPDPDHHGRPGGPARPRQRPVRPGLPAAARRAGAAVGHRLRRRAGARPLTHDSHRGAS